MRNIRRAVAPAALVLGVSVLLGGCASLSPRPAFDDVTASVEQRIGKRVSWEPEVSYVRSPEVDELLARPLTAMTAVQVALLNNRDLQATYAELGVAQADLVQAGLISNPIFDGAVQFVEGGGSPMLTFGLALKAVDAFNIPLRKRVAASELEEAKLVVAGRVLDVAGETMIAFVDYQARLQLAEVNTQVATSARASADTAQSLREAGNINALDFETQRAAYSQAKLDLADTEAGTAAAREKLNRLMGLYGAGTGWRSKNRLPDIPAATKDLRNVEARAVEASLELAAARQRLITLGHKYRVADINGLIPQLDAGAESERDDREWKTGPSFSVELPLFDRGQAKRAKALAEIVRARDQYTALAIRVRSEARLARAQLLTAKRQADYIRSIIVPQNERITALTQSNQTAMQVNVFQLLQAKRTQVGAGRRYVRAIEAYWTAWARFGLVMSGRLPGEDRGSTPVAEGSPSQTSGEHR